jgi:calcineurin-like phosphoesterase family protein
MHAPKAEIVDLDIPCLCGHVHDSWDYCYGWLNVGVDVWGFKPILLSLAVSTWEKARQLGVTNAI